jgi:hypothetical protein
MLEMTQSELLLIDTSVHEAQGDVTDHFGKREKSFTMGIGKNPVWP